MVYLYYLSTFSKTFIKKNETSKRSRNVAYRLKTYKILVPALHKIAILEKLSHLVHFVCTFSIAWILVVINQNIQKDSSTNFNM